jgi:putative flippase GtrA
MRLPAAFRHLARAAANLRRPALFAAVGLMSTAIDFTAYVAMTRLLGMAPLLANAFAYVLGSANGYVMNGLLTFDQAGRSLFSRRRIAAYAATYGLSLLAATATMAFLLRYMPDLAAKLITTLVTFLINYLLSRKFVFRPLRG